MAETILRQHYQGFHSRNAHESVPNPLVPRVGIPINLVISGVIGIIVGFVGEDFELGIQQAFSVGITLGFFFQEAFLVQLLSRNANIQFQHRILDGEVNQRNRLMMLFGPFVLILIVGVLLAAWNGLITDANVVIRVFCVSLIIMFGIDPLFGLVDKG